MSADPRLDERMLAYLDGGSTPADVADLERLLETDRAARDRFARLCEQDSALRQMLSASRSRGRRGSSTPPLRRSSAPWIPIAVAAAALFIVLVLAGLRSPDSAPPLKMSRPRSVPAEAPAPLPQPQPEPAPRPEPPKPAPLPIPPPPKPKTVEVVPQPAPEPPRPEPLAPKPPEPKPEPKPEPPKLTEAATVVARIEKIKGQAQILAGKDASGAQEAAGLLSGQGIQTIGADSAVSIRFPDATIVDLGGETRIAQISNGTGKRIVLDAGSVTATVSRQAPGQALVFATPHAEARVLGTKLTLTVGATETRLEVREGRVKLTRLSDNASVEVTSGQYAVASDSIKPVARKIAAANARLLAEDFDENPDARWQKLDGGFPITTKGALEIDLSPRPGEPYGTGWHASGGLRTKPSFQVPFRVSLDVDISHKDPALNTLVVLTPRTAGPRTAKNEAAIRLRDGEYSVMIEEKHVKQADGPSTAPVRERWTIEFGLKEIALTVNGKPVLRHSHGLAVTGEYFVELQGSAKMEVPAGARVRFDNVKIEP